jgi:hypothetical protein
MQLSTRQQEILLYGRSQLAGVSFDNQFEEWRGWSEHRTMLMDCCRGSARPHGYWVFELRDVIRMYTTAVQNLRRANDSAWRSKNSDLLHGGLFDAAPMVWADGITPQSENQPTDYCEEFASIDGIRTCGLTIPQLEAVARDFVFAAAFHCYRDRRPALVAKYLSLSAVVRQWLAGQLTVLQPPAPQRPAGEIPNPRRLPTEQPCAS